MNQEGVILITGASSGIGKAAVQLLHERGYRVYGASRNPGEPPAAGMKMHKLDVTSDESVVQCVSDVILDAGRIDVLINNAGFARTGPLEDVTIEELHHQFETNLYGVHRMTQAVLPQLFNQSGGRIVNVSSAIGRTAIPFSAAYCSSKFALEGYSEGLAKELQPHGIKVAIVEPGLTRTEFHNNRLRSEPTTDRYEQQFEASKGNWPERLKQADSAEDVAEVILRAVEDADPALRYVCPAAKRTVALAGAERL